MYRSRSNLPFHLHRQWQPNNRSTTNGPRANRKRNQDLELRLGQSESQKAGTLGANQNGGSNALIVVEDDDDDVQLSSPRSFAQARSVISRRTGLVPFISEEDLELRLGIAGTPTPAGRMRTSVNHNGHIERSQVLENKTIDICDDGEEDDRKFCKKRKHGLSLNCNDAPVQVKEIKLTCAICMDSMKEETSTVCGHIFCKNCITSAIQLQKKCPTCRRKLSNNNIHRIYLPSSSAK